MLAEGMIICGTDLSSASDAASRCAASFARKQNRDLLLVHVLGRDEPSTRLAAELRIEEEAKVLRHDFAVSVETSVVAGHTDQRLLLLASTRGASLIVVGAQGSSGRPRRLGRVPERLCQAGTTPVLVAKSADALEAWSRDTRLLKVVLGSGLGDASRRALRYVSTWPQVSLTVAHVAWPFAEHYRLGVSGPMPLDQLRPEVRHQLLGDLGRWASHTPCVSEPKLKVLAGWGRIDSHLSQLAEEQEADLLVVGSHRRNAAERVWHGSVSRSAVQEATCNVLCVPDAQLPSIVEDAPQVLVIPTDFSSLADRAIAAGYALLNRGTVHLVYVTSASAEEAHGLAELRTRVPVDAESRGISSVVQVLHGATPWLAIWQYAGRVNADLVCMAKHSREGVAGLVLGSQTQQLLEHSRVPVVIVPPDPER